MTFLNPIALWGLFALLIPVILHFLHRAEPKQQDWAAMQFLLEKEAHSVRNHTLREWLLLGARLMLVVFIITALAQPLGRLFSLRSSTPEAIFLLVDRSPGMGEVQPSGMTRMEETLKGVEKALESFQSQVRLYLIDSASLEHTPLLEAENLSVLTQTAVVDTPCSVPQLLEKAMSEIRAGSYGKVECWVITEDLKETWKPENSRWNELGVSQSRAMLQVRTFPVSSGQSKDLRLSLESAQYTEGRVSLKLNISGHQEDQSVLISGELEDGTQLKQEFFLKENQWTYPWVFSAEGKVVEGALSLPGDANLQNNKACFVVGVPRDFTTLLITDEERSELTENLQKAASLRSKGYQKVKWVSPVDFLLADLNGVDCLIWAASRETPAVKEKISAFVKKGALAFILPSPQATSHHEGWFFQEIKESPVEEFFTVGDWNEKEGPWRNAQSGDSLPLDRVQAVRYAEPHLKDATPLARWSDGTPVLCRTYLGGGVLYALSTLPHYSWSNLENLGLHLLLLQRLFLERLEESGGGYLRALTPGERPYHVGVKKDDGVTLAYNRKVLSSPERITKGQREALLKKSGISSMGSSSSPYHQWLRPLLFLALIVLLWECFLLRKKSTRKEVPNA